MTAGFSGSYAPSDVSILLEPRSLDPTPVEEKERLVQSGAAHYSELLAPEEPPDPVYLALFEAAMARNRARMGADVARVARALAARPEPGVLVSLARAGIPVGVLLRRALARLGLDVPHYAVSIIRDRGIDGAALDLVRRAHPDRVLWFVDGWTGKGAIRRELDRALATYASSRQLTLRPDLVVLADLAGVADLAASGEDYLIPCALLNAVVSGLISRSVLERAPVPGRLHGCVVQSHLSAQDRSRWFVDAVETDVAAALDEASPAEWSDANRDQRRRAWAALAEIATQEGVDDFHRVKPGIGEATRAVLRRVPERVLVRDREDPDTRHLVHLSERKGVNVEVYPDLLFRAVTVIRKLGARHRPWSPLTEGEERT